MRVHVSLETGAVRKNLCTNLTASRFIFAGFSQMLRFHVLAKIRVVPKSFAASGTLMRSLVRFGMSYKIFILGKDLQAIVAFVGSFSRVRFQVSLQTSPQVIGLRAVAALEGIFACMRSQVLS